MSGVVRQERENRGSITYPTGHEDVQEQPRNQHLYKRREMDPDKSTIERERMLYVYVCICWFQMEVYIPV